MKKLKVGIIGYGVVGKRRRDFIDINPSMKTNCVSDICFDSDGEFEDGVKYFKDYNKIFNENIDVVFISLPNYLAAEVTKKSLKNGCHVFCEKPPAKTVREIESVIRCSKKFPHLKLKYGFNHRYHDSVIKAKELIESKKYGNIMSFRGVYGKSSIIAYDKGWRSEKKYAGGGILIDQGIHMLDLIRYFSCDYDKIYSFISNDYWKHNIEDDAFILMKSNKGHIASLHSTATQWQHCFRLEIILKEGLIELAGILSGSKSYGSETLKVIERKDGRSTGSQEEVLHTFLEDNSWRNEINEFSDCITKDRTIENGTSDDALNIMKTIYKIYRADKSWWNYFNN
jgi:predicted dehydrogenase